MCQFLTLVDTFPFQFRVCKIWLSDDSVIIAFCSSNHQQKPPVSGVSFFKASKEFLVFFVSSVWNKQKLQYLAFFRSTGSPVMLCVFFQFGSGKHKIMAQIQLTGTQIVSPEWNWHNHQWKNTFEFLWPRYEQEGCVISRSHSCVYNLSKCFVLLSVSFKQS